MTLGHPALVREVLADVYLDSPGQVIRSEAAGGEREGARGTERIQPPRPTHDRDTLSVGIDLSALLNDGRCVAAGSDFGLFGISPRLEDIAQNIDLLLGRDPELHRPPRLAWGKLIEAMEDNGVTVSEQQLIEAPLRLRLSPQLQARLDGG